MNKSVVECFKHLRGEGGSERSQRNRSMRGPLGAHFIWPMFCGAGLASDVNPNTMLLILLLLASLNLFAQVGINYRGGKVLTRGVNICLVQYGTWPEADRTKLRSFVSGLNGSGWIQPATAYYDFTGEKIKTTVSITGAVVDPGSRGSTVNVSNFIPMVQEIVDVGGCPLDRDTVFTFVFAEDTAATPYGLGFHWGFDINGVDTQLTFSRKNDFAIFTHELIEAITDPNEQGLATGWIDNSTGWEVASKCQQSGSAYSWYTLPTGTFYLSNYWNLSGGCTSGSGSGGGGSGGGGPRPTCPPGTKPIGNSGKCR